jgi:RNA polymerase sigma-70 factor (ECF subfamily)
MTLFQLPSLKKPCPIQRPEDFARFYEQAHLSVFRYGMVLCAGNQAEAEDITAEAFFRAWEKRQQFTGSSSAALGWVITIARNILIDQRRSESAHPIENQLDEVLSDHATNIEAILIDDEQLQQVLDALQSLPFAQRNIFTLRYVLDWRVKSIAAHLGLAENTVSVDLRRALAKIQKQLELQDFIDRRPAKAG